jgi:hypothetical protein
MVRPEALWCSLCYARFDQAEEPQRSVAPHEGETTAVAPHEAQTTAVAPHEAETTAVAPQPSPLASPPAPLDPLTAPLDLLVEAADPAVDGAALPAADDPGPAAVPPVAARRTPEGAEPEGADVDAMLALLAAESRQQDALGTWGERLSDRTTRFLVMAGGVVVLSVALFAVLGVLSLLA